MAGESEETVDSCDLTIEFSEVTLDEMPILFKKNRVFREYFLRNITQHIKLFGVMKLKWVFMRAGNRHDYDLINCAYQNAIKEAKNPAEVYKLFLSLAFQVKMSKANIIFYDFIRYLHDKCNKNGKEMTRKFLETIDGCEEEALLLLQEIMDNCNSDVIEIESGVSLYPSTKQLKELQNSIKNGLNSVITNELYANNLNIQSLDYTKETSGNYSESDTIQRLYKGTSYPCGFFSKTIFGEKSVCTRSEPAVSRHNNQQETMSNYSSYIVSMTLFSMTTSSDSKLTEAGPAKPKL